MNDKNRPTAEPIDDAIEITGEELKSDGPSLFADDDGEGTGE